MSLTDGRSGQASRRITNIMSSLYSQDSCCLVWFLCILTQLLSLRDRWRPELVALKITPLLCITWRDIHAFSLMLLTSPPGLYMVGQKGEKGQSGSPGRCGCNAPSVDRWGSYPRVPAVSQQCHHALQTKPEYSQISVHCTGLIVIFGWYSILKPFNSFSPVKQLIIFNVCAADLCGE